MPNQFSQQLNETDQPVLFWREYFTDSILVSYIDLGLQSNLDLKMAVQRVTRWRVPNTSIAAGALLPSLHSVVSVGQQRFGEYTIDGVGNFDTNLSSSVPPEKRIPINIPDYYTGFGEAVGRLMCGVSYAVAKRRQSRVFLLQKSHNILLKQYW
ncbi:MAG: hypothetical protein U5K54_18410 [Cytophagales bacterium]|nr:hypothetical protein [Cytophagales bacterium]